MIAEGIHKICKMKCLDCNYEYSVNLLHEYEIEVCPVCGYTDDFAKLK